jgi:DNA repair protein RadD
VKPLYPDQAEAMRRLRAAFAAGKRRPLLQAPTGAGKTRVAAEIIGEAVARGKRVTFTVPALALIDQTIAAFWAEGIRDIGVIQAGHRMTDRQRPVQIASVQTLGRRDWPETDLVICDEAHRWFACYERWMEEKPELRWVGLSATPWTKGLGRWYDDLIVINTTARMIEMGRLSPFVAFAPAHPDLAGVKIVAGDYQEDQLSQAMNTEGLVADIVKTWLAKAEGRPTLVFAVDRAHARHLEERFTAAGVATAYQDALTPPEERAAIRRAFAEKRTAVVCNVGTLTTGVDWDVRCIVLARPTRSEILFTQIVGRGLRTAPGKDHLLILDHSDNHARLGFVTDIHHDTLDDGKPKPAKPRPRALPRECPVCRFLRPPRVPKCPSCGADVIEVRPARALGLPRGEAEGRLDRLRQGGPGELVNLGGVLINGADLYRELCLYAEGRGWKRGFAAHVYKEATGRWPDPRRLSMASEVSPSVEHWIRNRSRQFFAQRRKTA